VLANARTTFQEEYGRADVTAWSARTQERGFWWARNWAYSDQKAGAAFSMRAVRLDESTISRRALRELHDVEMRGAPAGRRPLHACAPGGRGRAGSAAHWNNTSR